MIVLHLSRMNSLVGKKLEKLSFQKDGKIEPSKIDCSGKSLMKIWAFFVQILFLELLIQRLRLKAYNEMKISPIDFTIFGQI